MHEYQVRWFPNYDDDGKPDIKDPYKIEIIYIKLREIILKKTKRFASIQKYSMVPLYEKLQRKSEDGLSDIQ